MNAIFVLTLLAPCFQQAETAPDSPALEAWRLVNADHRSGELNKDEGLYQKAEEGYRRILRDWPQSNIADMVLEELGDLLLTWNRPAKAREAFLQLEAEDAKHTAAGMTRFRPTIQVKIGKTYEAEGNWGRALHYYREGEKRGPGDFGGCGTCEDEKELGSQTRIVRCLHRLGRNEEAMGICRKVLFETDGGCGGRSTELSILAVDIAISTGGLEELERDLISLPRPKIGGGHAVASLKYLEILRLRAAGDIEGLFRVLIDPSNNNFGWQNQYRWEELKAGGRLAIEAAECLAELGDPAFGWLESQAQEEGSWQTWATIALAHFRTERAGAFVHDPPSRPRSNGDQFVRMLEEIHSGTSRKRRYPPPPVRKGALVTGLMGFLALVTGLGFAVRTARRRKILAS